MLKMYNKLKEHGVVLSYDIFYFIYGALKELEIQEDIFDDIVFIENNINFDNNIELTPFYFLKRYSAMAFLLANEHYESGRNFNIAKYLLTVFKEFLDSDFVGFLHGKRYRKEISDTIVDFKYASGSFCMSLRLYRYTDS